MNPTIKWNLLRLRQNAALKFEKPWQYPVTAVRIVFRKYHHICGI